MSGIAQTSANTEDRVWLALNKRKEAHVADVRFGLFCRRRNQDGTVDAICTRCYRTVSTSRDESDLKPVEQSHDCDEFERQSMSTMYSDRE
jgi:hypothetical protein